MDTFPSLQDIPPRWAHFCLKVGTFFEEILPEAFPLAGKTVLISLSGGADSTALAAILHLLAPRYSLTLRAAHLDHAIRPESVAESAAVSSLCDRLHIPLASERQDIPTLARDKGIGLEEAGREARQAFLDEVAHATDAHVIAVGHHLNDLAEDVLMRLTRGTGWPTLAGMRAWCPETRTARPLLMTSKRELMELNTVLGLAWSEDTSNEDTAYFRNLVRHRVLPVLEEHNPRLLDQFAGLWQLGELDRDYWDHVCRDVLGQSMHGQTMSGNSPDKDGTPWPARIELRKEDIIPLPRAARLRVFKRSVEQLGPGQPLMANLLSLDKAFLSGVSGKTIQFPGDKVAEIIPSGIRFACNRPS